MRIDPDWPEGIKRAMRAWRDEDLPAIMRDEQPPEVLPHPDMVAS